MNEKKHTSLSEDVGKSMKMLDSNFKSLDFQQQVAFIESLIDKMIAAQEDRLSYAEQNAEEAAQYAAVCRKRLEKSTTFRRSYPGSEPALREY